MILPEGGRQSVHLKNASYSRKIVVLQESGNALCVFDSLALSDECFPLSIIF